MQRNCELAYLGVARALGIPADVSQAMRGLIFVGENTEREKLIMYLTVFKQNGHGVSRTSGVSSFVTLSGNDRRHSVQVITIFETSAEQATAHQSGSAPVWIPRNGKDSNGIP